MDVSAFKKVVYDAARSVHAHVVLIREPNVTPNFIAAMLHLGSKPVWLIRSHDGNWALCRTVDFEHCRLEFEDFPHLAEVLEKVHGIRPVPESVLAGPFTKLKGITESDIKYWKPQTFGDAMFNWWD